MGRFGVPGIIRVATRLVSCCATCIILAAVQPGVSGPVSAPMVLSCPPSPLPPPTTPSTNRDIVLVSAPVVSSLTVPRWYRRHNNDWNSRHDYTMLLLLTSSCYHPHHHRRHVKTTAAPTSRVTTLHRHAQHPQLPHQQQQRISAETTADRLLQSRTPSNQTPHQPVSRNRSQFDRTPTRALSRTPTGK